MIMMAFKEGLKVRYSSKYLSVSEVPPPEVEIEADDHDADDDMDAPEDLPIIDLSSDDDDDGEEPEYEPGYGGWIDEGDEFEDDQEEICTTTEIGTQTPTLPL
ncbi:hypothetical protein TIFTF001_033163 [Ficus carica]|uniref:Uncharacterized protein n=1 Tax=Ficus carica TaxID=3494 RepID=A0AA88E1H0_FICCA|nr:hypothetical protein TIFTF001_033163 [Ficus carica]